MEPAEVEPCLQRLAQLLGQRVAAPPRRLEAFIGNRLIPVDEGMVLQRRGKAHGEEKLSAGRPSPRLATSGQRAVGVQVQPGTEDIARREVKRGATGDPQKND